MTDGTSNGPDPRNPFVAHRFVGRIAELWSMLNCIAERRSVSVIGLRSIGKSATLRYLASREGQQLLGFDLRNFIFIPLDFVDYQRGLPEDFFSDACKQTREHCEQKIDGFKFQFTTNRWDQCFRDLLRYINDHQLHPVLIIDGFDKVASNEAFDNPFLSVLRSLATRGFVTYVIASTGRLAEMSHKEVQGSPFFNIFVECLLGPLTPDEAKQFIMQPVQDSPYGFTADEVHWILQLAGRHPYFLQVTCREFFNEKLRNRGDYINREELLERINQQLEPLFKSICDRLNAGQAAGTPLTHLNQQLRILIEEAHHGPGNSRSRRMPEMSESLLFRMYVHSRFNTDAPSITYDDVKDALDLLRNIDALGKSKLAETYYVTSRYERALHSNLAKTDQPKKGKIVLDLLRSAHASMSPGGQPSNSAGEWRFYNILSYRYFKYHLSTDQTRARLQISNRRDYFREQRKAIETLCAVICELETAALQDETQ
jgi:hypothetical protein